MRTLRTHLRATGWLDRMMYVRIIFLGSAYALRGYGVTLGSSSLHDLFSAALRRVEPWERVAACLLDAIGGLVAQMGQAGG